MGLLDEHCNFDICQIYKNKILKWAYNYSTYGFEWFKPLMRGGYEIRIYGLEQVTDPSKYYFHSSVYHSKRIIILRIIEIKGKPSLMHTKFSGEVIDEYDDFVTLQNALEIQY